MALQVQVPSLTWPPAVIVTASAPPFWRAFYSWLPQLRVQGDWPWWLSLGVAAPIALAFDVAFIRFADMSLPKGSVWG